jgi:triosephosphate isomerase
MRVPILAGNWKMNKLPGEAVEFTRALRPLVLRYPNVETVVCPPFVDLPGVADALAGVKVGVGAQNCHWADSGAYTGEVSAPMLVGLADYVIVGHSERRPILCVGEDLAQNEAGVTDTLVSGQLRAAFDGISAAQAREVVVAYEPIWAIGTGKTASAAVAERVCGVVVRGALADLYGSTVADAIRIQYGGSANEKNIAELMAMPDIDGALIGGASLKVDAFSEMVKLTAALC